MVVGINSVIGFMVGRAKLVGAGEHDLLDRALEAPVIGDETLGEMIEQGLVRGSHALGAEVVWCLHDTFAEEVQPKAVGHHAGGEGIVLAGDEPGEDQADRCLRRCCGVRLGAEHFHQAALHDGAAGLVGIAPQHDRSVGWSGLVKGAHDQGARCAVAAEKIGIALGLRRAVLRGADAEEVGSRIVLAAAAAAHLSDLGESFSPCLARFVGFLLERMAISAARDLGQCGRKPGIFFELDQLAGMIVLQLLLRAVKRVGAEEDARERVIVALRNGFSS